MPRTSKAVSTPSWTGQGAGPTATGFQRARRRGAAAARALVLSTAPPGDGLVAALRREGIEMEWTSSGPAAVSEVLAGDVAICVVVAGREGEMDFLPCINQVNPLLPIIVQSDADSLDLQRKIRCWKIFYYHVGPLDSEEASKLLRAALRRAAPLQQITDAMSSDH